MAMNLSLGSVSQQIDSIEIDPSARVLETECHTTTNPNISKALVSDAHTSVSSAMPETVTDVQGGFRVNIDSNISSPVPMELDPTQRGNSVAGTESELVGNDATPVVEPTEVTRLREEKQNEKRGEGEMSEKKSKPLDLDVYEKEKECLREKSSSRSLSTSNVTSTLLVFGSHKDGLGEIRVMKKETQALALMKIMMLKLKGIRGSRRSYNMEK